MSIATAISNAQQKVANCYTAISNKGGTLPATQNLANMPTAIGSIPSGGGTKYGANINCVIGDVDANGVLQAPTGSGNLVFTGVEDISSYGLNYRFYKNTGITSVSFPDLVTLSGSNSCSHSFYGSTMITSVNLSSLETVTGSFAFSSAFQECKSIESIDLSNLKTINASNALSDIFYYCEIDSQTLDLSSIETVSGSQAFYNAFVLNFFRHIDLSNLQTISGNSCFNWAFGYMWNAYVSGYGLQTIDISSLKEIYGNSVFVNTFNSSKALQSISFDSLDTIPGTTVFNGCFAGCQSLTSISFPSLTTTSFGTNVNQFNNMFNGGSTGTASTSGSCTVHFPSNLQSTISGLTGYPLFGGTSGRIVLAFDLPATS